MNTAYILVMAWNIGMSTIGEFPTSAECLAAGEQIVQGLMVASSNPHPNPRYACVGKTVAAPASSGPVDVVVKNLESIPVVIRQNNDK